MSYFLISDFVYVIITTVKKKGKKRAIIKTAPKTKKDDCDIQNGVNVAKLLLANRKVSAIIAGKGSKNQNVPALVNKKISADWDILVD